MKNMKCSEMGGPCDAVCSANTWEEMTAEGMKHLEEAHPEMAAQIKAMSPEEMAKWEAENKPKFDALPDAQ
ncbi:MAG: DUF1059 domain-containing protein [Patescibacteria group bacterium]